MKRLFPILAALVVVVLMFVPWQTAFSYPINGVEKTNIRRLVRLERMDSAKLVRTLRYGARYSLPYVRLNLMDNPIDSNLLPSTFEE